MSEPLQIEAVRRDLDSRRVGGEVVCLGVTTSTNDVAFELAAAGAPDGTVVTAEEQTGGRGRLGREWRSPAGGLWFSILLRPELAPEQRPYLTVLAAVALADALAGHCDLDARIRWPNDIMLQGRKAAGILVEVRDGPNTQGAAVVGIGVNISSVPDGLDPEIAAHTTSIAAAAGRPVDRTELLRAILCAFDARYLALLRGEVEALDRDWARRSGVVGRRVRITQGESAVEGMATSVGALAGVTLSLDDGSSTTFRSEHITRLELL
ncbi:MAG: biotin--[acetyl-CoA-carboxylase] ligase [Planctomycetota bacterium]|jgi:BirA family biotin operon repressor/biotin-[acetyl-CoA-carboxylase] ligase